MTPIVSRRLPAILLLSLPMTLLPAYAGESDLPAVQTQGDISFLSGGIGSDETAAIKAAAPGYALTLQFSASTGAFLASVGVSIRDAAGTVVLDTVAEGPYLLVNLAPGRYKVTATLQGVERTQEVTITAGTPQQRNMVWPPHAADPEPKMAPPTLDVTGSSAVMAPVQSSQGGVPYLTGGIGSDESAALKAQFSKYALALTFASVQSGHNVFLASVPVQIRDATGSTVLEVTTGGPYLLVDVPPGRYEVIATHAGKQQRASVNVAAGRSVERAFVWSMP